MFIEFIHDALTRESRLCRIPIATQEKYIWYYITIEKRTLCLVLLFFLIFQVPKRSTWTVLKPLRLNEFLWASWLNTVHCRTYKFCYISDIFCQNCVFWTMCKDAILCWFVLSVYVFCKTSFQKCWVVS